MGCTPILKFNTLIKYAVIKGAKNVTKLLKGVDLKDTATLAVAAQTAIQSIKLYIKEGFRVIIYNRSGNTGTFDIQIAKIISCIITAICSGLKVKLYKSLNTDNIINYKSTDMI
jgi:NADPH:quinone reductase-like Zn-dependent oxidoreductase